MISMQEGSINDCRIGDIAPQNTDGLTENVEFGECLCTEYCVIGASVQGKFHKINNTKRDDSFVAKFQYPWLVITVADGAGSKENSRYGAQYCTNSLCDDVIETLNFNNNDDGKELSDLEISQSALEKNLMDSLIKTRHKLDDFAKINTLSTEDLHCTLLIQVINVKTGNFIVGQVGDGLILGLTKELKAVSLVEAKIPEDPGATYFFTEADWQDHYVSKAYFGEKSGHYKTFYIMTDGVANDCQYEPPIGIIHKWAKDIDREIRAQENLGIAKNDLKDYLENYKAPGSFDDRTLVVTYRKAPISIPNE